MSSNEDSVELSSAPQGLDAHKDARAIIRLFQCSQCSYPFREPMTLPCGYSLCRPCLPPLYKRENITYPLNPGRAEGFVCPFKDCG
jgi:Zinc finger, C3HC4 type (RING finger)